MGRYAKILDYCWSFAVFFLDNFFLVEQLNPTLLTASNRLMNGPGTGVAIVGISLLISDVILPVPSSLVMIANGALFGIVPGTLLSVIGSLGAALVGFFIGRRGSSFLIRFVPVKEQSRANRLLAKWGLFVIISFYSPSCHFEAVEPALSEAEQAEKSLRCNN